MAKTIVMSGIVGREITPANIRAQLNEAKNGPVQAEISSPGGLIVPGIEIFNLFKQYKGKTSIKIIGLAGSMASIIPLAFDNIESFSNSVLFIHLAMTTIFDANRNELRKRIDVLNGFDNILIRELANRTGQDAKKIEALMSDETFFFGAQLKEFGFSDNVIDTNDDGESNQDDIILNAKTEIYACQETIKKDEQPIDQIAALLTNFKPAAGPGEPPTGKHERVSVEPNNSQEEKNMDWEEYLKTNPTAKATLTALLKAEKETGATEAKAEASEDFKSKVTKVTNILQSDAYDTTRKAMAVKALAGDITMDSLDVIIAMYDSELEQLAAVAAVEEQPPPTPPTPGADAPTNEEGVITNIEAYVKSKKEGK